MTGALVVLVVAVVVLSVLHRRSQRADAADRARLFERVVPLVQDARLTREGGGYPVLTGRLGGHRVTLRPIVDAVTLRKLPVLWVELVVHRALEVDGTVNVLLRPLGTISAIVLTAGNHQRSAWRFRKLFNVPVWAPEDAHGLEDEPDNFYTSGDSLPGGLSAFHTPGPAEIMYTLWLQQHPRGIVFLSDLLTHEGRGRPEFVPSKYQDAPQRTRLSVQRVLDHLPVDTLCFAHGEPIVGAGKAALRLALEFDSEGPSAHAP